MFGFGACRESVQLPLVQQFVCDVPGRNPGLPRPTENVRDKLAQKPGLADEGKLVQRCLCVKTEETRVCRRRLPEPAAGGRKKLGLACVCCPWRTEKPRVFRRRLAGPTACVCCPGRTEETRVGG